jgi:hypothetical protein
MKKLSTPTKKPTTTPKEKIKSSGKNTTTRAKKPKSKKVKPKQLSKEEMHPFSEFPFRLEYTDGKDHRICHFQCEEHLQKHIKRYRLRKNKYKLNTNI